MKNDSGVHFYIKAEYDGKVGGLFSIAAVAPMTFAADLITENVEAQHIKINPAKIKFPSLTAFKGLEEAHQLMFTHLYFALYTTCNFGDSRLNTGFGVKNGKMEGLINSPEELGEAPLLENLYDQVKKGAVDWATFFCFSNMNASGKHGISIDILHPKQCLLFFIPFSVTKYDNGQTLCCLDVTQTELVVQGDGVAA